MGAASGVSPTAILPAVGVRGKAAGIVPDRRAGARMPARTRPQARACVQMPPRVRVQARLRASARARTDACARGKARVERDRAGKIHAGTTSVEVMNWRWMPSANPISRAIAPCSQGSRPPAKISSICA